MAGTTTTARARLARLAALVTVGALTLTGCDFSVYSLPLPGGADLGDHPYTVHAEFHDVLDLVPQSAVKVDDVTVGKVESISLDGYTADVTLAIRGNVKLPDNAVADIRQTSLLGEKFISLSPPSVGASTNRLSNGDRIPLSSTGRNPEVEEVLGAMSLLLNGGGVAQLKTISAELNKALSGRESDVRSVLDQINTFMGQLDDHKDEIVHAIDSLDRLAIAINRQDGSIKLALDQMPQALASINRQRDDLVKMLKALSHLSGVATHVISASKVSTIDSLQALSPTLDKLAEAGNALPKAFQVFLTYPFVDATVGKNPVQARNLHMGDYTNLSVRLDADLTGKSSQGPGLPGGPGGSPLPGGLLDQCKKTPLDPVCSQLGGQQSGSPLSLNPATGSPTPSAGSQSGPTGSSGSGGTGQQSCLVPPLVCRAVTDTSLGSRSTGATGIPVASLNDGNGKDTTLGALLVWGMVQR